MQLEAAQDAIDQKVGEFRNLGLLQRLGCNSAALGAIRQFQRGEQVRCRADTVVADLSMIVEVNHGVWRPSRSGAAVDCVPSSRAEIYDVKCSASQPAVRLAPWPKTSRALHGRPERSAPERTESVPPPPGDIALASPRQQQRASDGRVYQKTQRAGRVANSIA